MPISWSAGADINQIIPPVPGLGFVPKATPFAFQVLAIPAAVPTTGQTALVISIAITGYALLLGVGDFYTPGLVPPGDETLPLIDSPIGEFTGPMLTVYDAAQNVLLEQIPGLRTNIILAQVNLPISGGSIWLSGTTSLAYGRVQLQGLIVACVDTEPAIDLTPVQRDVVTEPGNLETGIDTVDSTGRNETADAFLQAWSGVLLPNQAAPAPDFSGTAGWTNVVTRAASYTFCDYNSDLAGAFVSHAVQRFTPYPPGTLPPGATGIELAYWSLEVAGILFTTPGGFFFAGPIDSGGEFTGDGGPVVNFPAAAGVFGGPQVIFNPLPDTAAGFAFEVDLDYYPTGLSVDVKFSWQVVVYCNNQVPQGYSVGIGQYQGPVTGHHQVPVTATWPSAYGAGLYTSARFARSARGGYTWSRVIGPL
jgi:hypothetical protein